jgi:hypothetical protein
MPFKKYKIGGKEYSGDITVEELKIDLEKNVEFSDLTIKPYKPKTESQKIAEMSAEELIC